MRFPAPRRIVWQLIDDHLNDTKVLSIHPLIQSQKTVARDNQGAVVERAMIVGKMVQQSRWRFTLAPPERFGWEILESKGPWAPGSHLELEYATAMSGTNIRTTGDLTILATSRFTSERHAVEHALEDLHTEDEFFIRRYRF
ncbi:MAG: hypothetical protein WCA77_09535 [Thermoplasmata archaeon]